MWHVIVMGWLRSHVIAFAKYESLWKHPGVSVDLKVMFFRALVESLLTYGLECVTLSVENMHGAQQTPALLHTARLGRLPRVR